MSLFYVLSDQKARSHTTQHPLLSHFSDTGLTSPCPNLTFWHLRGNRKQYQFQRRLVRFVRSFNPNLQVVEGVMSPKRYGFMTTDVVCYDWGLNPQPHTRRHNKTSWPLVWLVPVGVWLPDLKVADTRWIRDLKSCLSRPWFEPRFFNRRDERAS